MSNDVTISVPISTVGPLDTTNPPTDRPAGTLIEAINLGSRWWGPRIPNRADTWLGQRITTGSRQSQFLSFNGSTQYVYGVSLNDAKRDLGLRWTVDVWAGLADVDSALSTVAASNKLGVFDWSCGMSGSPAAILIYVGGPNGPGADLKKVVCVVKTSSSPGVVGNTYTIKSSSTLSVNTSGSWVSDFDKIAHIRLVRDKANLYLYINGVLETTQTISATEPHQGTVGSPAGYGVGYASTGAAQSFIGIIPMVMLRTDAYLGPVVATQLVPQIANADDVRLCLALIDTGLARNAVLDSSDSQMHGTFEPTRATVSATWQVPGGAPIQGIGHYINRNGKHVTAAMIGGTLCKVYN